MFIEKYTYVVGDTTREDGSIIVKQLNRHKYMTNEYAKYFPGLFEADNKGSTAFLYAGGPASHHSDIRNIKELSNDGSIVIKGQIGFTAYNVARRFSNIDHVSINANTCASSMYCFHEARWLLSSGYDDVIIFAEDMVEQTQLLLFEQLGIELACGDGAAMMHLTRERTENTIAEITDTAWAWNKDTSPMSVSQDGYNKVLDKIDCSGVNTIKPHGTGTPRNDAEEDAVIAERFGGIEVKKYKQDIGHTQGASSLIELGMLLDDVDTCVAVCLASGLGAHYGAIKVVK